MVSSLERVTDPAAIRLLERPRVRRVLGAFMPRDGAQRAAPIPEVPSPGVTVAGAARTLALDIRAVHRDVQALTGAGLLQVAGVQPRAGRAVRHYRASAAGYFVPFEDSHASDMAEAGARFQARYDALYHAANHRAFARALHEQAGGRQWGLRLYADDAGQVLSDWCYLDAALHDAGRGYQGPTGTFLDIPTAVTLTQAQAEEVQLELIRLIMRLRGPDAENQASHQGRPYLLRLGLAPVSAEEVAALRDS
jgi:hypothetical protein